MRQRKVLGFLIGALVVLILTYVFFPRTSRPKYKKPFRKLTLQKIKEMWIEQPKDTFHFVNTEKGWMIYYPDTFIADTMELKRTVEAISKMEVGRIISSDTSDYPEFDLTDKAITVKIIPFKGKKIVFRIGKVSADRIHSFVRFLPDKRVFLVKEFARWRVNKSLYSWREKTILRFDPQDLVEININYKKKKFKLEKKDDKWYEGEKELKDEDKKRVDRLINIAKNLRADQFFEKGEIEFKKDFEVVFKFADGTEKKIEIGKKEGGWYPVKVAWRRAIFKISKWKVNQLNWDKEHKI